MDGEALEFREVEELTMQYLARGVDRESPVLSSRRGRLSQNPNSTSRKQRLSINILEFAFRN
jgi:hypothetical protein